MMMMCLGDKFVLGSGECKASGRHCCISNTAGDDVKSHSASGRQSRRPWLGMAALVLASMLPCVLCSAGADGASIELKSQRNHHDFDLVRSTPRLRKSVSYSSKMDRAVHEPESGTLSSDVYEAKLNAPRTRIYTPVHSSSDLGRAEGLRSRSNSPLPPSPTASEEIDHVHVYTRLQKQLFPEMRF